MLIQSFRLDADEGQVAGIVALLGNPNLKKEQITKTLKSFEDGSRDILLSRRDLDDYSGLETLKRNL